jgi:hypothetical protein
VQKLGMAAVNVAGHADAPVNRRITGEAARTSGNGSSTAQHAVSSGLMADVDEGLDTQHADAAQQDYSQHGFNAQVRHVVLGDARDYENACLAQLLQTEC